MGGGPACCSPPATGADGFAFVELIYARRVVAMGEVDLLVQGGNDSTPSQPFRSHKCGIENTLVRPGYNFSVLFLFTLKTRSS